MTTTTRTLNPLPFEHLEPRRFEDLVRQLAYDFRVWRALEATGRSGSDDGFDARGWEIVAAADLVEPSEDETARDELAARNTADRKWLIQCKREKQIGPKKIVGYLHDIPEQERPEIYGVIFAAACDFSKKTRDDFREECRGMGFSECHLWGRGEIEDMLFQPKNDGLLFAYFGISLRIRKRSLKSELRDRLISKRKAFRIIGKDWDFAHQHVLIIDPEDKRYPHCEKHDRRWRYMQFLGHDVGGMRFLDGRYRAYLDKGGKKWDAAFWTNDAVDIHDDPWISEEDRARYFKDRQNLGNFWAEKFEEECRGWFEVEGVIKYEDIIEIDEYGDKMCQAPHLFVNFNADGRVPFDGCYVEISVGEITRKIEVQGKEMYEKVSEKRQVFHPKEEDRILKFPKKYRMHDRSIK